MIDLINIVNTANSIGKSLSSVYEYLTNRSNTKNRDKKLVFRELKNNLKRLENRNKPKIKLDKLIESLENDAIKAAFDANFNFNQLAYAKNVLVTEELIFEKRNQKYIGWDCEKLIASIDSKIEVMKNSLAYFENIEDANSNFRLKLSNLYFQILLLVLLINQSNKWHS